MVSTAPQGPTALNGSDNEWDSLLTHRVPASAVLTIPLHHGYTTTHRNVGHALFSCCLKIHIANTLFQLPTEAS